MNTNVATHVRSKIQIGVCTSCKTLQPLRPYIDTHCFSCNKVALRPAGIDMGYFVKAHVLHAAKLIDIIDCCDNNEAVEAAWTSLDRCFGALKVRGIDMHRGQAIHN